MSKEITFRARLAATRTDWAGYVTYVFENLEAPDPEEKYIMCVRFPGWDEKFIKEGETGFVTVRYVSGGKDNWFDGRGFVPYQKTDIHFLKFVPLSSEPEDVEVIL